MVAVDTIVDRDDDIATVRAIHALAARNPGVLVLSIPPGIRGERELIWAILRALGKRIERVERVERGGPTVSWGDAERWLTAHAVDELVVLCAQHLGQRTLETLQARICRGLGIAVTLVHGGPAATRGAASTTLDAYLSRERRQPEQTSPTQPWPRVPRSHPLRLRYDCRQQLAADEFACVERLLIASTRRLRGWRSSPRGTLERAFAVVSAAEDPEQAHIRRCGAELALIGDHIPVPSVAPLTSRPDAAAAERIEAIRAYTDPATAGYQLTKLITGLPDRLLALTAADQITDRTILGCPVPDAACSILRAIDKQHHPVIQVPYNTVLDPIDEIERPEPTADEKHFAAALRWLLRGRGARIPARILSPDARTRFDALQADDILEWHHRDYQASRIALYSTFREQPDLGSQP